jgi:hypothetical protein
LDARLGDTGVDQPFPNVYRGWNGQTLGISSIQVVTADAVPEPSTYALVLGGIATLLLIRRRIQA